MPDTTPKVTLTAFQRRALEAIAAAGERGHTGRSLAQELWPDSPAWDRRTRGRNERNGAIGGTMPMKGGRAARTLDDLGLVRIEDTEWHQPFFKITARGRELLAERSDD
ncbi:hypothetical protein [Microbacterium sp. 77mftsu3.1]|uniref:hypothetical protein n=1 Tax=Microbacterium sp. 77mftsu3.1 TaxID=1761802 RepID=UPI0003816E62|nr:hypothetical protein [Microbacterium sp. 77mftsu3.1]SDH39005.1 hypothetical protein SAMN04488590_3211 [Microbacterium sp. 77mftsu3.1]